MLQRIFLFLFLATLGLASCKKEQPVDPFEGVLQLPEVPYSYSGIELPNHFLVNSGGPLPTSVTGHDNTPTGNPITDQGATLGRVLFYDKNLSKNRTVSCASCHQQANGFSDPLRLSTGFEGGHTRRHSMSLVFARYYQHGRFFWDERAATLEQQVLLPIQDVVEMGLTLTELEYRVRSQPYYEPLFNDAFGNGTVNADRISRALAQFVRSIVSYQSKYDAGRAMVANPGQPFPNFTPQENQGKQLFFQPVNAGGGGCFGCHTSEAFINSPRGPLNNGLDPISSTDRGAFESQARPDLLGAFKTTTLRNIADSAPYMHDGRFATLDEVVEHYNSGVQAHPNLAPALRNPAGEPLRLNLSAAQKSALVAFLHTLSDPVMRADPKYANPFLK
jgi:cytochrome c peroxidase